MITWYTSGFQYFSYPLPSPYQDYSAGKWTSGNQYATYFYLTINTVTAGPSIGIQHNNPYLYGTLYTYDSVVGAFTVYRPDGVNSILETIEVRVTGSNLRTEIYKLICEHQQ